RQIVHSRDVHLAHPFVCQFPARPPRAPLFPYTTLFRSRTTGVARDRPSSSASGPSSPSRISRAGSASPRRRSATWEACLPPPARSEEHTSELQSHLNLVCRLLLEKKNQKQRSRQHRTYT